MYPRTVKIRSTNGTVNEYVRVVEAFREDGKVKQRVVADLGRKDLLVEMLPRLQRLLAGDQALDTGELPDPRVVDASTWGPVLAVRTLFDQLGLLHRRSALRWLSRLTPLSVRAKSSPREQAGRRPTS